MKKFVYLVMILIMGSTMAACSAKRDELKSPCVGLDDSPCGPKRNVNDWWLS